MSLLRQMKIQNGDTPDNLAAISELGAQYTEGQATRALLSKKGYISNYYWSTGLINSSQDFLLITPNDSISYVFNFEIDTTQESEYYVYVGSTISANGTALNITNRDLNESSSSNMEIYRDPTITSDGTQSFRNRFIEGVNYGGAPAEFPLKLKNDNTYLLRVTTRAITNRATFTFRWSEF